MPCLPSGEEPGAETMSDDDRPRRSWREIDRAKDRSVHRKDERPEGIGGRQKGQRRERSYRAALDRLFESGKIADLMELQTGEKAGKGGDTQSANRIKMQAKIRDAIDRETLSKEVDAYVEKFGDLPEEIDLLARVIEHRDPSRQFDAMQRIEGRLAQERPRRTRAMIGQLKMIRDIGDDPELTDLAVRLIEILE